jgi:hypothetical protein
MPQNQLLMEAVVAAQPRFESDPQMLLADAAAEKRFHCWASRAPHLESCNRILFDERNSRNHSKLNVWKIAVYMS